MFEGNKCPYCGKVFTANDDIAVCPECGTPHHRSCYKEHGVCANESKHGTYTWIPDKDSASTRAQSTETPEKTSIDEIICTFCGQHNALSSRFCSRCGNVLDKSAYPYSRPDRNIIEIQQISTEERIDGIPIKDWLVYLGPTAVSLVRSFLKQNNKSSKWGFSIGAFLFPVLYYLYYKIWSVAAFILFIDILCNAPTILIQLNYPAASLIGMSAARFSTLADILSYTYLAVVFIISLFSKTIVRKSSSVKIKKIRRSCTNEIDYANLLSRNSCPNKIVVSVIIVIYILSFLLIPI